MRTYNLPSVTFGFGYERKKSLEFIFQAFLALTYYWN